MNKIVKLLKSVTLFGHEVEPGENVEVDEVSATALVKEGAAEEVEEEQAAEPPKDDAAGNEEPPKEGQEVDPAEAIEMQKKALDDQYKADELKKKAKEIGVEFPYDANKGEVIETIIAAGKAEEMLK